VSAPTHVKVFLGSPADVTEDRNTAARVLKSIEGNAAFRGRLTIEVFTYDDPSAPTAMPATETPELAIAKFGGRPSRHDITIILLWSRMGTRLPSSVRRRDGSTYDSGTQWELEDARRAGRDAFVYLRSDPPAPELLDSAEGRDQLARLRKFVDSFRNHDGSLAGFVYQYSSRADLEAILEKHMQGVVRTLLERSERKRAWLYAGSLVAVSLATAAALLVRQTGATNAERERARHAEALALDAQRPQIDFRHADACVFAHGPHEHDGHVTLDYGVEKAGPTGEIVLVLTPDKGFADPGVRHDLRRDRGGHPMRVDFTISPAAVPDWRGSAKIVVIDGGVEMAASRSVPVTCRAGSR